MLIRYQTFFQTGNVHLGLSAKQFEWNHNSSLILHAKTSLLFLQTHSYQYSSVLLLYTKIHLSESIFTSDLKQEEGFLLGLGFFAFKLQSTYSNFEQMIWSVFSTCNSQVCLVTAFFFILAFTIKEILKIFIFSELIFLSTEAHSYTYIHYYPWKAALALRVQQLGTVAAIAPDRSLPPFQPVHFCETKTMSSPASYCWVAALRLHFSKHRCLTKRCNFSPICMVGAAPG